MNSNELGIADKYIDQGWTLIRGGAPDFMFVKSEDNKITDVLFVEVKTPNDFLSFEQATYRRILEEFFKAKYKLEVVKSGSFSSQSNPCQTNSDQSIPGQPNPTQTSPSQSTFQAKPYHAKPTQPMPIHYGDIK